jgi:hypothetical protein
MAKFYYQPFAIFQANEIIFQLSLFGLHSFSIPAPPSTNQPNTTRKRKTKNKKNHEKEFPILVLSRCILPAARLYIITVIFASLSPAARMQCTNTQTRYYIKGDKK